MNISETKAMWIGTMKNSSERPLGLEWCLTVKKLGVFVSCNQKVVSSQNFQEKFGKIKKVINIWNMRGLSLVERVTIIETFLITKPLYVTIFDNANPNGNHKREEKTFSDIKMISAQHSSNNGKNWQKLKILLAW